MLCDFCTEKTSVTYKAGQAEVCFYCYRKWLTKDLKKEPNKFVKEIKLKEGEYSEYQYVTEKQYADYLKRNNKRPIINI